MPIDLRERLPPEPMEIILQRAETLESGTEEQFILPHFPTPLLPLLDRMDGVRYRFELSGDGGVLMRLERE
ncbi:DUF2249 domain-containing protein [Chromobacterium alticapitis]|uniref:DUF2249 domain-containing protein n=1 Tax=Chromobacterium alticapitis TaxID=2073169 RepID=A0A2S5DD64_9NEIS|nr:DUF2249 domain-containing protein [Chromobacterium alticapitis]POZ60979.1 hypothetical protein C2I19_15995 [Chromobacterium alticapitis]